MLDIAQRIVATRPGSRPDGAAISPERPVFAGRLVDPRRLALACLVPLAAACEDVVVTPAEVASIRVVPADVEVSVGTSTSLSADPQDEAGRSLSGYSILWTSDDESIAAVNGSGVVSGGSRGTTVVRAKVGGVEGTATVRVLAAPAIGLSRSEVAFAADKDGSAPSPATVSVSNEGEAPLTGLSAAITYGAGASGWLSTNLSGTTAPATLTLVANPSGLDGGEYHATVTISSSSTQAAPVTLSVSLEVVEVMEQAGPPATPSELSATPTLTTIQLAWTANSEDETEFRIHRRTGSGSHQQIATVAAGVTTFTDSNVVPATTYGYRVRACNAHGCSALSSEATASIVLSAPTAPSNLRVTMNQRHRVRLAWDNNSQTATEIRIQRAVGSGQFSLLDTIDIEPSFYDDRSVNPKTTYSFRVFACIATACSGASNTITVTTPD